MLVKQAAELANTFATQSMGYDASPVQEDLQGFIEFGKAVISSQTDFDNLFKSLPDRIARMIYVNRPYNPDYPSIMMDNWEYKSIVMKVHSKTPVAEDNMTYELVDGISVDQNIVHIPEITVKFFNKLITWEIPQTITRKQLLSALSDEAEYLALLNMLENEIEKAMTIREGEAIMAAINNAIAENIYDATSGTPANLSNVSTLKVVNLKKLWNDAHSSDQVGDLDEALENKDFCKFAVHTINKYPKRLSRINTRFNIGGTEKFTPSDRLKSVFLDEFVEYLPFYLYGDTFHSEDVKLLSTETVPYWQATGSTFDLDDITALDVITGEGHTVSVQGVLGIMFDRDAIALYRKNKYTTTAPYNARGEYYDNFHKYEGEYCNDFNENMVVFVYA